MKRMKLLIAIALLVCVTGYSFGQTSAQTPAATSAKQDDHAFQDYCLQHALQVITVPAGKSTDNLKIAGEVTLLSNKQATYRDYGIALKESETQYYRIAGSPQLLLVNSVYRLRVGFNAEQH